MCSGSSKTPVLAYVALGSNLGDSAAIVLEAFGRLERLSQIPLRRSSLWQTTPVDCPPGSGLYVNAVAGLAPLDGETPETLLEKLQPLEREFGRRPKKILNEPRPLDLDLIAFGDERRQTEQLRLPHPRAHLRRFVLEPLSEIAGNLILPGQRRTIGQLLSELFSDEQVRRLEER
jgi:2-amino-4-hydroxy-6-hydroxymethyldihydropteridine diphosphokinase